MNLFDKLVNQALKNQPELNSLRMVVEKELLHHDILRILSNNSLLKDLTFIGGTCLRACYGSIRLSEDLDFTGGKHFSRKSLSEMGKIIEKDLYKKYNLPTVVSEPIKDIKNVNTWKIKIQTKPKQRHIPAQRINIDICTVNSYDKKPAMLLNPYGVDMGTNGLIIQAESLEEIYIDKLLAFSLRPNRLKYRDLWDIVWLHQQRIKPNLNLYLKKLQERNILMEKNLILFNERVNLLKKNKQLEIEFKKEIHRFLSSEQIRAVDQRNFWDFIISLIEENLQQIKKLK